MVHSRIIPFLVYLLVVLLAVEFTACRGILDNQEHTGSSSTSSKISIAEWSPHRNLKYGHIKHLDFPRIAADSFNLYHIEYVSQFFQDKARDFQYLDRLKDSCKKYKVANLLIMVDAKGNLEGRKKAAEHLGCRDVRVNGYGSFYI